ncbi:MAG: NADH-quinone oxidoreductase subunit L [Chloroflexota bacterium]
MAPDLAWLFILLPLLSFLLCVFVTRPYPRLSGYVTIAAVGATFLLALLAFWAVGNLPADRTIESSIQWVVIGGSVLKVGLVIDSLTAIMLIIVSLVSFLIQIYSQGYMAGDPGYSRYYAFMSLFTASMLGLVLASNLLLVFIFWELVGLCSYLLIGFWYQRPAAAAAAKKAFLVTRLGDLGFLTALLVAFNATGNLDIRHLIDLAEAKQLAGITLTAVALGIFSGAVGKSAQFPLHVWLPDAMEGPTPVSALIHAATMVAAGVYLVGRTLPLFLAAPDVLLVVAVIGGLTAFIAATMGLVMTDIKRVLAYSTISQLGYMMMGLGVGGFVAGIFHLFNHAFFKALLFLAAGSVIHSLGTQDLREMGGLRRFMPVTFLTMLAGALSLAGLPPFSGFWSKDEILLDALRFGGVGQILYVLGLVTAFLTAFYTFRMFFLAFGGEYRGVGPAPAGHSHHGPPHESPPVMTVPLILLAVPSVLSGFLAFGGIFGTFGEFLISRLPWHPHYEPGLDTTTMALSALVSLLGIFGAYAFYGAGWVSPEAFTSAFRPIHTLLVNRYYMDHLYNWIARRVVLGVAAVLDWVDRYGVDGVVNAVAELAVMMAGSLRLLQRGWVQFYALMVTFGIILLAAFFGFFGDLIALLRG